MPTYAEAIIQGNQLRTAVFREETFSTLHSDERDARQIEVLSTVATHLLRMKTRIALVPRNHEAR
jgi:hypothetical protein